MSVEWVVVRPYIVVVGEPYKTQSEGSNGLCYTLCHDFSRFSMHILFI